MDGNALADAFTAVGVEIGAVDPLFVADQTALNNAIQTIATSGLPSVEVQFLQAAGWSSPDIQAMGDYVGGLTLDLAVSNISLVDGCNCSHDTLSSVPEPSTLGLLAGALIAIGVVLRSRKEVRA